MLRSVLTLLLVWSVVGCSDSKVQPRRRAHDPYSVHEVAGDPDPGRVAALSDLDAVWIRRSQHPNMYDGRTAVVRRRLDASSGPATSTTAAFLVVTLGNRSGSQGPDRDRDGLSDEAEVAIGTNPDAFDTDGDTIPDGFEVFGTYTRAERADSDGDGTPDNVELNLDDLEIYGDRDGDGLRNGQERASFGSDPDRADSDGDGFDDIYEYYYWTAMNDASHPDRDSDQDGQPDAFETANHTDPMSAASHEPDADGDALPDFADDNDGASFAWVPGHRAAVAAVPCNSSGNSGNSGWN